MWNVCLSFLSVWKVILHVFHKQMENEEDVKIADQIKDHSANRISTERFPVLAFPFILSAEIIPRTELHCDYGIDSHKQKNSSL